MIISILEFFLLGPCHIICTLYKLSVLPNPPLKFKLSGKILLGHSIFMLNLLLPKLLDLGRILNIDNILVMFRNYKIGNSFSETRSNLGRARQELREGRDGQDRQGRLHPGSVHLPGSRGQRLPHPGILQGWKEGGDLQGCQVLQIIGDLVSV